MTDAAKEMLELADELDQCRLFKEVPGLGSFLLHADKKKQIVDAVNRRSVASAPSQTGRPSDEIQSSDGGVEGHAARGCPRASERPGGDSAAEASNARCRPTAGVEPCPSEAIVAGGVRDVTEAMALAGARSIGNTIRTDNHMVRARECWKAMWAARDGVEEPKPRNPAPEPQRGTDRLCSCRASDRDGQHMMWCPAIEPSEGE